jgi:hypothetical protein
MPYKWVAVYKDGSTLEQYNASRTPQEISSEQIDRAQVDGLVLFDDADGRVVFELHLDEGQRLIYRARKTMKPGEGVIRVVHLVGWQQTITEIDEEFRITQRNIQSIAYCFESGEICMAGRFQEGHPLFYPIVLTETEKQNGLVDGCEG